MQQHSSTCVVAVVADVGSAARWGIASTGILLPRAVGADEGRIGDLDRLRTLMERGFLVNSCGLFISPGGLASWTSSQPATLLTSVGRMGFITGEARGTTTGPFRDGIRELETEPRAVASTLCAGELCALACCGDTAAACARS
jgi:hypothetical protein